MKQFIIKFNTLISEELEASLGQNPISHKKYIQFTHLCKGAHYALANKTFALSVNPLQPPLCKCV